MNKKFGYYVFGGMLIGTLFGTVWAVNGNSILGMASGGFVGAFIGWFIAAYIIEKERDKSQGD